MILIPVKNLSTAKQRLAAVLDQPSRTELAQTMLHDVVAAIAEWPRRPSCALVTGDPFALEMATNVCVERGIDYTLVIPADIPLIHASELDQIFAHAPEQGSVLAPAADGRGTNAAFRRPVNLFPLRFGNDSFKPHLAAAQSTGKPCIVLQLPGIALDVDNPENLHQLLSHPGETRTQSLLRRWSLGSGLLARGTEGA